MAYLKKTIVNIPETNFFIKIRNIILITIKQSAFPKYVFFRIIRINIRCKFVHGIQ